MNGIRRHLDNGSLLIIAITLVLFAVALFTKGLSHDLLLEAGVFLVSVKLILMAYKDSVEAQVLDEHVARLEAQLARIEQKLDREP